MANSSCKVRVCIDLDFDDLMNPRVRKQNMLHVTWICNISFSLGYVLLTCYAFQDLGKCVKQMMRCYTLNRRTENPMQLYFTSFNGKSEQEMSKNNGYNNWDVSIAEFVESSFFCYIK